MVEQSDAYDKTHFEELFGGGSQLTSTRSNVHRIEGHGATHGSLPSGEIKTIKNVKYVLRLYCNILFVGKITDKGHIAVVDKYSYSHVNFDSLNLLINWQLATGIPHFDVVSQPCTT
uniref:Retrovirus-related Pol polyprotein from transposon TNT 1-94-like beta-barrel domain-containing protein n=1 Tax=Physcomitrium patens TaxID=3218 RepID=A0A2K1L8L7_PHYPA|nr:hypothetical protein PHYPA_000768 [Physcomitrium patens]